MSYLRRRRHKREWDELDEFDQQILDESDDLIDEAEELGIQVPEQDAAWENIGGFRCLTPFGQAKVKKLIREEKLKIRDEKLRYIERWVRIVAPIITALAGLIGVLIGLITVVITFIKR